MGIRWRTDEQDQFLAALMPRYLSSSSEGTLQAFWTEVSEKWFERFPVSEPPPCQIQQEGSLEKATNAAVSKKLQVSEV
jgi:hypothetical protein